MPDRLQLRMALGIPWVAALVDLCMRSDVCGAKAIVYGLVKGGDKMLSQPMADSEVGGAQDIQVA
jgi:hypothetical protein